MEQSDLQRHLVKALEGLGVRYFITGSAATIFYGEPRFTNDIDVVADLELPNVPAFLAAFPDDEFYLSEDAIRQAVLSRGQFNVIHPTSGLKVDVMIPKLDAFDQQRLARVVRIRPAADYEANYSSPEDIILKKMDFYREGGSDKHLRDITGVLKILGDRVDRAYVADWARRLGLTDVWEAVLQRATGGAINPLP